VRSARLSLLETVRLVARQKGVSGARAQHLLREAASNGEITASGHRHASAVFPQPEYWAAARGRRFAVSVEEWADEIGWRINRVGRFDLVQFDRAEIERWLAPDRPGPQSDDPFAQGASGLDLKRNAPPAEPSAATEGARAAHKLPDRPAKAKARQLAQQYLKDNGYPEIGDGGLRKHLADELVSRTINSLHNS
jgi:hypothetical protein